MLRGLLNFIWETAKIVLITLLIVAPIRYFIFQPFFVRGQSMEPSFHDGDYLIVDQLSYRFRAPHRGETIVFKNPRNISQRYIKRIVALPGEAVEIEDGQVLIKTGQIEFVLDESGYLADFVNTPGTVNIDVGEDEYFVLGDNRYSSSDSRSWGLLPRENIVGRVLFRAWPLNALAWIEAPTY